MKKISGADYAPKSEIPCVEPGIKYNIAAVGIDHGHIFGMIEGLTSAGATLKYIVDVNDVNSNHAKRLKDSYPEAEIITESEIVFNDPEINLVCTSAINSERSKIAISAMENDKDIFSDKPAITSLKAFEEIVKTIKKTGHKFYVYYGELIHNESALYAQEQIRLGRIGKVIQVIGTGPHREGPIGSRADWFYDHDQFGGILTDIGSHQVAQYLAFSNANTATIKYSHVGNYAHQQHPGFEDFGEFSIIGDNGSSGYFRVDWFTPTGLSSWSDGRIFILGTEGTIELRKYCDIAIDEHGENNVYIATKDGEEYINVTAKVGFDYFKKIIEDSMDKSLNILDQANILEPTKIALLAQNNAELISWKNENK